MSTKGNIKKLILSSVIFDFALASSLLFEPIYLYRQGLSVVQIIIFYLGVYTFYFCIMPLGGKVARARGYVYSILASSLFLVLYYLTLVALPMNWWFLPLAGIFLAFQKMLYWVGYLSEFARYGTRTHFGEQYSLTIAASNISAVLGPVFGGLIAQFFGIPAMFFSVMVLILISNLPLLFAEEKFEPHFFSYADAYRRLIRPRNWHALLGFMGYGEEFAHLTLWPIYLVLVVPQILGVGLFTGAAAFIAAILSIAIGKYSDRGHHARHALYRNGAIMVFIGWFLKAASETVASVVFLADAWTRSARYATEVPFVAATLDVARSYSVTKTMVFLQLSVILGKILFMLAALFCIEIFGFHWAILFVLAGSFALLRRYFRYRPLE